jgi:type IV pilus assembly protein PilM
MQEMLKTTLEKARGWASLLRAKKDLLAIDLGSHAIKIILLTQTEKNLSLKAWGYLPLAFKPEASLEDKKTQTINALRAFLIKSEIRVQDAVTSLSGNSMIVRYVKFPLLTKSELSASIATEAEPFIPFDVNDVQFGFHILNEIMEEGQKKMNTVLVAAKKEAVLSRVEILQGAGLNPAIIDVDSFALENLYSQINASSTESGATLYLNIGHSVTNLSIINQGVTCVVRDIFISGQTFTRAIMKALDCDATAAETIKKSHVLLFEPARKDAAIATGKKDEVAVSDALTTALKDLASEVHRSVDFFLSQGSDHSISRLALMGGSSSLQNLNHYFASNLNIPVSTINAFTFVEGAEIIPPELAPAFAVAVGLGLRKPNDWL